MAFSDAAVAGRTFLSAGSFFNYHAFRQVKQAMDSTVRTDVFSNIPDNLFFRLPAVSNGGVKNPFGT